MTTQWLLYGLLTSFVLTFAALALEQVCRIRSSATRWVWIGAMIVPFLLPFTNTSSGNPQMQASSVASASPTQSETNTSFSRLTGVELNREHVAHSLDIDHIVHLVWLAASGVLAMTLALGSWHVRRKTVGRAQLYGTQIEIANNVGPAVIGCIRPRIVVPTWFLTLDRSTQRAALMHERSHVDAHDSRLLGLALLLLVAMPWNVPLWWQWRRLRHAIEIDCDARVLRGGQDASTYGAALLRVAEERCQAPLFAPAMNGSARALEQRIELLFARRRRWPQIASAMFVALAAGCTVAAAQVDAPTAFGSDSAEPGVATKTASVNSHQQSFGDSLIDAALWKKRDAVRALLASGADPNHVRLGDGTALILASRSGDEVMVQLLLQHGADVNLGARGDGNPLIMAAARGNLAIAKTLVESGADVNGVVIGDETPLINAARRGHLDLVRYLVQKGADVNLAASDGNGALADLRSPLSEAKKYRRTEIVSYLQAHGARQ